MSPNIIECSLLYQIVLSNSLHFLFNFKLEKAVGFRRKSVNPSHQSMDPFDHHLWYPGEISKNIASIKESVKAVGANLRASISKARDAPDGSHSAYKAGVDPNMKMDEKSVRKGDEKSVRSKEDKASYRRQSLGFGLSPEVAAAQDLENQVVEEVTESKKKPGRRRSVVM